MAIYTFSTKTRKPEDEELVDRLKHYCSSTNLNFSGLIITLLRAHEAKLEVEANARHN